MMRDQSYSPPPLLKRKATTAAASFLSLSSDSSTCSSASPAADLATLTSIRNDSMNMRLLPKPPPRIKKTASLNFTTPPRSCSSSSSTSSSPSSHQEMATPRASPPPPPRVRRMTRVDGVHHVITSNSPHREWNQIHQADDTVDSCAPLLTPTRLKQRVHEMKSSLKISNMADAEDNKTERNLHTEYEQFNQRKNDEQGLERFGICTLTNSRRQKNIFSSDTQHKMDPSSVQVPSLSSPSANSDQSSTYYSTPVRGKSSRSCSTGSRGRSSPSSFSSSRSTSSTQSRLMMSSPMTASSSTCSRSATLAQAEISSRLEAKEQYQMHKMRVVNLLNNSPRSNIRRHPNQHQWRQHGRQATESLNSNPRDRITSECGNAVDDGKKLIQSALSSAKQQHPSHIKQCQKHPHLNHEMLIHPASVDGTIVAAAWHLHGQTGGRKSFVDINTCRKSDPNDIIYSAMNARDIVNVMRKENKEKTDSQGDTSRRRKERRFDGDDATNLSINVTKNGISIMSSAATTAACAVAIEGTATHCATRCQRDAWSTGIAAAVVTGIAARYNKTFFMFPHGRKVLLPIITGALAAALSLITLISCQFMTISSDNQENDSVGGYRISGGGSTKFLQVGPWRYLSINPSYSDGEVCLFYPSHLAMDLPFLIARSTSALASFSGFVMVLWTSTLMCVPISGGSMNALGVCFALVGVMELLTALIYQSETCRVQSFNTIDGDEGGLLVKGKCRPNQDLVFCIASSTLYMVTGWLLYASHKFSSDAVGNTSSVLPVSGFAPMEVYTWSEEASSSNPNKGILRTVEKCWTKIPDGSTLMATVLVEQRRDAGGCNLKTTYSIQTEIVPA